MDYDTVATQIRIPAELFDYIRGESKRIGISQNAVMLFLMDMGRKLVEAPITRKVDEELGRDPLRTLQQRP